MKITNSILSLSPSSPAWRGDQGCDDTPVRHHSIIILALIQNSTQPLEGGEERKKASHTSRPNAIKSNKTTQNLDQLTVATRKPYDGLFSHGGCIYKCTDTSSSVCPVEICGQTDFVLFFIEKEIDSVMNMTRRERKPVRHKNQVKNGSLSSGRATGLEMGNLVRMHCTSLVELSPPWKV